ncbi:hypothetical protein HYDPIDRAFT_169066, partial [Hydnomerulius pinastri MD-312]
MPEAALPDAESLTINGTMAVTIFGNIDRLQMVMQILAYADELWTSEYNSDPSTVALIGTFPSCIRANGKLITRHRTRDAYDLQLYLAGVIMAVDCAILAIPNVGVQSTTMALSTGSFSALRKQTEIITIRVILRQEFTLTERASLTVIGLIIGILEVSVPWSFALVTTYVTSGTILSLIIFAAATGFRPGLTYDDEERNLLGDP